VPIDSNSDLNMFLNLKQNIYVILDVFGITWFYLCSTGMTGNFFRGKINSLMCPVTFSLCDTLSDDKKERPSVCFSH